MEAIRIPRFLGHARWPRTRYGQNDEESARTCPGGRLRRRLLLLPRHFIRGQVHPLRQRTHTCLVYSRTEEVANQHDETDMLLLFALSSSSCFRRRRKSVAVVQQNMRSMSLRAPTIVQASMSAKVEPANGLSMSPVTAHNACDMYVCRDTDDVAAAFNSFSFS